MLIAVIALLVLILAAMIYGADSVSDFLGMVVVGAGASIFLLLVLLQI